MKDVMIVLGGGVNRDGSLPEVTKERVIRALELYKSGAASHVLMSGKWGILDLCKHLKTEAEAMDECMISLGVPKEKIYIEERSRDTIENAFFSKVDFCEPRKWKDIIVITSDFHIERTRYIFKKVFESRFNLEFIASETELPSERIEKIEAKERELLSFDRQYLDKITDGDDEGIKNLLLYEHPIYKEKAEVN